MSNYWKIFVDEVLPDLGINANKDQADQLAEMIEGAHENYGMATGNDIADQNYISDEARELEEIKANAEKLRLWECKTQPCKSCTTTGLVVDGWGRNKRCDQCSGEGRHH